MIGVVAGKFWPLHKGHAYLLRYAARNCDQLEIFLVGRDHEFPAPKDRALAIYEELAGRGSNVRVHIVGDIETDDGTEESSKVWADYTKAILGYHPDIVFSSEEYGIRWARHMGAVHEMVGLERKMFPISGTVVRENFFKGSAYLPAASKALVLPRVVVMGSESTGTTTIAKALGEQYSTAVVPEYGRILAEQYKEKNGVAPPLDYWTDQIFRLVAHGQNMLEEQYVRWANGLLICDTDSLATAVWYERYRGRAGTYFDRIGLEQAKKHSLYLVTSPEGVPWEDDGTRDGEMHRAWMHEGFKFMAKRACQTSPGCTWQELTGSREERLAQAIAAVDKVVLDKHAYSVVQ